MRSFLHLIRSNFFFLIPYVAILLAAGISFLKFSKEEIHISINHHYSSFGDLIMPWITWVGDGYVITVVVLLLFALNRNYAFFTGISCLLASGITQLLKHTLFYGDPRPAFVFQAKLRYVPGVENHFYDTFPSGHTTLAFAFFFAMSLGTENRWLKMIFFLCAALIGYSRIYLSQHFLEDVYAGSIIGTFTSLFILFTAKQMNWMKLPALTFRK